MPPYPCIRAATPPMRTILAVAFTHVGFRYGSPYHSDVTVAWQVVMAMFPEQVALFALAFLGLPCLPDGVTFSIQAPSSCIVGQKPERLRNNSLLELYLHVGTRNGKTRATIS